MGLLEMRKYFLFVYVVDINKYGDDKLMDG